MCQQRINQVAFLAMFFAHCAGSTHALAADASIGGFIPFIGIGLTDQFKTLDDVDLGGTFFIADPSNTIGGAQLGIAGTPYYDLAILDTGAATHILTQQAFAGFDLANPAPAKNFEGTEIQTIGGVNGLIDLDINDALGVYAAGLGDLDPASTSQILKMNSAKLRGQTSFATLTAPSQWQLPNIIGLPMAAQHAIAILNSEPQIFEYQGRTMRTPQVELRNLGSGGGGILRRTSLKLRPGIGFIQGPLYVFNLGLDDILGGELEFHEDPASPTVVENAGLFVEVDLVRGALGFQDKELLLDTGADLTVISQLMAKRLGFDAVLDTPDFFLEVEGVDAVLGGVPGIFLDELNIDTIGGSFTLHNVPVAVIDLPNPNDPGNTLDGILGMHVFNGRNIVIDANPAIGQGGNAPSLYISDPITKNNNWATAAASGSWTVGGNWSPAETPDVLSDTTVANVSGGNQTATLASDATVFRLTVAGTPTADMTVRIDAGATLTTFGETLLEQRGRIELAGGKLDAQFVNIVGGVLTGSGDVFVGTGPIRSPVRNISGRVEPGTELGGLMSIDGDFTNLAGGTLAIDLAGTTAESQYDVLDVSRIAFLGGTLEVRLTGGFTPNVGNMFTVLTTGERIEGSFDTLSLPAGYLWDVDDQAGGGRDLVLTVIGLGLAGDYNGDGRVDAADYTAWRDHFGAPAGTLPNDVDGGMIGQPQYDTWVANFGNTAPEGGGSIGNAAVPEPDTLQFGLVAYLFALAWIARGRVSTA
jgi:hypothetical protein